MSCLFAGAKLQLFFEKPSFFRLFCLPLPHNYRPDNPLEAEAVRGVRMARVSSMPEA